MGKDQHFREKIEVTIVDPIKQSAYKNCNNRYFLQILPGFNVSSSIVVEMSEEAAKDLHKQLETSIEK